MCGLVGSSSYDTGLPLKAQQWVDDHRQHMLLGKPRRQWAKEMARNMPFLFTRMRQARKRQAGSQYQVRREVLSDLFYYVERDMRLMATSTGHIGWAHVRARVGDSIFILEGSAVPVILRPRPEGGFVLVGDAFVCGMMSGEAMKPDEDPPSLDRDSNTLSVCRVGDFAFWFTPDVGRWNQREYSNRW
ncbi:uncharacterized protein PG986_002622 [Apiospora aurea]|uniref:Uncharacterized protein n=1 Tax=Apiospora aurea TaxID=335848 RepID=A0ABR1QQ87_9PEZI